MVAGPIGGTTPPASGRLSVWRTLVADERHASLPALLLGLTVLTGVVDAVSILSLGRVFVANMTGNVAFVGFAAAGVPGFSLSASLAALAGFLIGAFASGVAIRRRGDRRAALLRDAVGAELGLVTSALVIAIIVGAPFGGVSRVAIAAVLAIAMGIQNGVARRLAVPDLTTTVLTMTLTGIASDLRSPGHGAGVARRLLAVTAMLLGAVCGALLILHSGPVAALCVATGLLLAVGLGTTLASARLPAG